MQIIQLGNVKEQNYTMKESLRGLKTNLSFCGDDIKTVLLTSTTPDEGKSTVTFELARSLTESGKSVLLIDTDMRKSVLASRLKAKLPGGAAIGGLSHLLSGQKKLEEIMYATSIPKLFMVFAGPSVPNPTEILEKQYFTDLIKASREHFDYVLIDCAPIGAAIDSAIIAKHCDGAIIVIAQGQNNSRIIQRCKKQLESSGVRILGAVMNKVQAKKNSYYGKYYGSYYGSYYGNEDKNGSSGEQK